MAELIFCLVGAFCIHQFKNCSPLKFWMWHQNMKLAEYCNSLSQKYLCLSRSGLSQNRPVSITYEIQMQPNTDAANCKRIAKNVNAEQYRIQIQNIANPCLRIQMHTRDQDKCRMFNIWKDIYPSIYGIGYPYVQTNMQRSIQVQSRAKSFLII